jgi:hypothetical protein
MHLPIAKPSGVSLIAGLILIYFPAYHDRGHPEGQEPGLALLPECAADRRRIVSRDGNGVQAAPPRAAADLWALPVPPQYQQVQRGNVPAA